MASKNRSAGNLPIAWSALQNQAQQQQQQPQPQSTQSWQGEQYQIPVQLDDNGTMTVHIPAGVTGLRRVQLANAAGQLRKYDLSPQFLTGAAPGGFPSGQSASTSNQKGQKTYQIPKQQIQQMATTFATQLFEALASSGQGTYQRSRSK